jgi:hypothetical protein
VELVNSLLCSENSSVEYWPELFAECSQLTISNETRRVRTVPGCGQDDLCSISGKDRNFYLCRHVYSGSVSHPVSFPLGTGVQLPGCKAAGS